MAQMRTWKKTVKGLVSTVPKKPVPMGRLSRQRLDHKAAVVPSAATQPRGRRSQPTGIDASMSMTTTPVIVRMISGRMRRLSDEFMGGPPQYYELRQDQTGADSG